MIIFPLHSSVFHHRIDWFVKYDGVLHHDLTKKSAIILLNSVNRTTEPFLIKIITSFIWKLSQNNQHLSSSHAYIIECHASILIYIYPSVIYLSVYQRSTLKSMLNTYFLFTSKFFNFPNSNSEFKFTCLFLSMLG